MSACGHREVFLGPCSADGWQAALGPPGSYRGRGTGGLRCARKRHS